MAVFRHGAKQKKKGARFFFFFFCGSRFPFLFSFRSPQDPTQTNDSNLTAIDEPTGARVINIRRRFGSKKPLAR